jgi:hypothetical protein
MPARCALGARNAPPVARPGLGSARVEFEHIGIPAAAKCEGMRYLESKPVGFGEPY